MQRKIVTFIRHGQAQHNIRAEAARHGGCSFDRFLELMKLDDAFDAALTELGKEQAQAAFKLREKTKHLLPSINLVVSSPLSRAIDTAKVVFPTETMHGPFVCLEEMREINGLLLNAKRLPQEELAKKYGELDCSLLRTNDDLLWDSEKLETTLACADRGVAALEWVWKRSEHHIAIAAHGGIFHYLFNEHPRVQADETTRRRFNNCELKSCYLTKMEAADDCFVLNEVET